MYNASLLPHCLVKTPHLYTTCWQNRGPRQTPSSRLGRPAMRWSPSIVDLVLRRIQSTLLSLPPFLPLTLPSSLFRPLVIASLCLDSVQVCLKVEFGVFEIRYYCSQTQISAEFCICKPLLPPPALARLMRPPRRRHDIPPAFFVSGGVVFSAHAALAWSMSFCLRSHSCCAKAALSREVMAVWCEKP